MHETNRFLATAAILLLPAIGNADEPRSISLTTPERAQLIQQSPHPGQSSPYVTTVYARSDGPTIHFRFECTDPEPSRISVHTMQHDADMTGDDTVAIVLDTFHDKRSGYFFSVNAAGARAEGLISDSSGVSLDWDGVWDADVQRTPFGWTAELTIPVATLSFPSGSAAFGFNAERHAPRDNTILRFASPTLDSSLYDFSRAGTLSGVGQLRRGHGASVTFNGVSRVDRAYPAGPSSVHTTGGVDASYEPTPGVSGTLTTRTDFAETEVDTRQVNLTRFPLFFPEKRRFFAEGANLFNFGYGLGTLFVPFYSRRIGLVGGEVIPVEVGGKLLGRSGPWSFAMLGVRTGDSPVTPSASTLFAARGTYDVDEHLRVGGLVTHGDPLGTSGHSLEAMDGVWNTPSFLGNRNLIAAAWGGHSSGNLGSGEGWGATLAYPNDRWNATLSYDVFGNSLDPSLGFLPRPGTRYGTAGTNFEPRPAGDDWIRQYLFQLYGTRTSNLSGQTESTEVFATPFGFRTRDGARFEFNVSDRYERVDEPFPLSERAVVGPGQYRFTVADVQIESPPGRPLHSSVIVARGTFYGGRIQQWITSTSWSDRSARLQLALDAEIDSGTLRGGAFTQRLYQFKAVYGLSPRLIVSSYTQFDSESHSIGMNNRLRWMLRPNADLFLVWNRGWVESPLASQSGFQALDQQLVAKIRWILQ
ncbi:MAG TPA: DUF5916 domain-containing protein [Thermoanaerobaculia bacterium]|nr:DUF5916 domain-containing protein [Thermoanaerobaculia bacterium]